MGSAVVPLYRRPHDAAFVFFLVAQVVLILAIESQYFLFPAELYPKALRDAVDYHVRTTGDFLVRDKPPYFRALVLAEIFLQAPLGLLTAYALIFGRPWGRITGLIYGVHTSTSLIPLLAEILAAKLETQNLLLAAYLPFLVIPLLLVFRLLPSAQPFTETRAKRKKT